MNRSRIAPLVLALLCMTSLGIVGTALDSSLTTDPDEEIDLNYDRLPIGTSDAAAVQEEIESGQGGGDAERQARGAGWLGTQMTQESLLARLLALLGSLVRLLAPLGIAIAVAALAYRYRERILSIFGTNATADDGEPTATTVAAWPEVTPSNPVDRAWLWMVRRADPERPAAKTPAECARAARERGLDAAAVDTITDAFERVHYGGVPVERESERARAAFERLRSGGRERLDGDPSRRGGVDR